jgi:hypothetical protein
MKWVLFYHSLLSDWNHGNAHFLRGIVTELLARGHRVDVCEPRDGWSLHNLRAEHGEQPFEDFRRAYPWLDSIFYDPATLDLEHALDGADVVLVHEWNAPALVNRIGAHRARHAHYRLLFHDTHHRAITDPNSMARNDLTHYDGVLAFGQMLQEIYLQEGRARCAGSGTKQQIRGASSPARQMRPTATWSGSATGATRRHPRTPRISARTRPQPEPPRPRLWGALYGTGAAGARRGGHCLCRVAA